MQPLQFPIPSTLAPAELPPIAVGEQIQHCGYGDRMGWIVAIVGPVPGRRFHIGFGTGGLTPIAQEIRCRIVEEDGRETMHDIDPTITYAKRKDDRIAIYRTGESPAEGWQEAVEAAKAGHAARVEAARIAHEAATAAGRAECARLSAAYPGALVIPHTGPNSVGRFAVGVDGSVSVWTHGGHTARTYRPGDTIRHGSYNFDYTGTMTRATAKTVFFTEYGKATKISAEKFYSYNVDFDLTKSEKRRAEWSD